MYGADEEARPVRSRLRYWPSIAVSRKLATVGRYSDATSKPAVIGTAKFASAIARHRRSDGSLRMNVSEIVWMNNIARTSVGVNERLSNASAATTAITKVPADCC